LPAILVGDAALLAGSLSGIVTTRQRFHLGEFETRQRVGGQQKLL
jgi:hypothetical protein